MTDASGAKRFAADEKPIADDNKLVEHTTDRSMKTAAL